MTGRVLRRSLAARPGPFALTTLAVAAGAAVVAVLLGVGFAVGERMAAELRGFGANIVVVPRTEPIEVAVGSLRYVAPADEAWLADADLPRIKAIFWGHNVVALAPFLSGTVTVNGTPAVLVGTWFDHEVRRAPSGAPPRPAAARRDVPPPPASWRTGLARLAGSWHVEGRWATDGLGTAMVGRALATRLAVRAGDRVEVRHGGRTAAFAIAGVVTSGGPEDDQLLVDLARAQALLARPGRVDRVQVSALVTPDNALAERARRTGPDRLSPADHETWYCTPYLDAIAFQIEEALPGARARPLREVAQAEARFLTRVTAVFLLVGAVGVLASALAVSATAARAALERRHEVGVMKALGAAPRQVALLFLAEATLAGLAGGMLGVALGAGLVRAIGRAVFAMPIALHPLLAPGVLAAAVALALAGTAGPLAHALRVPALATLGER